VNSRERILAAVHRQPVDRVPTDIWATDEVWAKLRGQFGADEQVRQALHIDGIADIRPEYIGPEFRAPCPPDAGLDFKVAYGIWGAGLRWQNYGTGRYLEQVSIPFKHVQTVDDLNKVEWPSADWFDYEGLREIAKRRRQDQVVMCGYMAPVYVHNLLRGMEQSLLDPLAEPELTHLILQRVCDYTYEYHRRSFEACDGLIDISQVTDDLGGQNGPLFSLGLYREFYKPHHQRFINLCREFDIRVFHHDDGGMRPFLPDLVEMGIEILNPVQHACPGMDMVELKRNFGRRICFHGGVENQKILPFGTPDEVRAEVRRCIDALADDHTGYILAPCHNLQSLTPIENIIAMYDEAWNYGQF
jgi:uroporphyrinogen decarboxylase